MKNKLKYQLYEKSVQSVDTQVDFFDYSYGDLNQGKRPKLLREDFCGTFAIACKWVEGRADRQALGLDLDPEPLSYGRQYNLAKLPKADRKRVKILRQNVISTTSPKADVIAACNFSFNVFKQRQLLIQYFKQAYKSLRPGGTFVLEAAGGPGMIAQEKERKRYQKDKKPWFTYVWDQQSFDPVTHDAYFCIHFRFPNGKTMEKAFVYDWRLWTIPEIRECLTEAGFRRSTVYWEETDANDQGLGTYYRCEQGENDYVWITYIVGQK